MGLGCATATADTSGSSSASAKSDESRQSTQRKESPKPKDKVDTSDRQDKKPADTSVQGSRQQSEPDKPDEAERPRRRLSHQAQLRPGPADDGVEAVAARHSPAADADDVVVTAVPKPVTTSPGPPAPADGPTALEALALARPEQEKAVRGPDHVRTSALVTRQAATPIGLAPGIVVPPSVIGHYEATGAPSLTDRITVFAMEVLNRISDVIGVNIVTKLGEAILSPKPPWFTTLGLDVTKSEYDSRDVWTITPPSPSGEVVVGVHGSGFYYPPNIIHWLDYTQMARQTGATVIVPRYPLIPDGGTAANTVPPMADFIAAQVQALGADKVSVYGDSAGGTLAMLAVQKIVRDCAGDAACLAARVPSRMVLVSPGLSGPETYTDPNAVLVNDPVIDIPDPEDFADWEDPLLSNPNLGPFVGLPPTTVYVGSREISAPGVLTFGDRLLTADPDAGFHVVIGMGQIHNWAQGGGIPINSQTGKYRDDVYRQLGIVPVATRS